MATLIVLRRPQTGLDVQTLLENQNRDRPHAYQAIACPACERIHFIDTATGMILGVRKSPSA